MAVDPRKRQKKLEKQKAKQKERKKVLAKQKLPSAGTMLQRSGSAPISHCVAGRELWTQGMGSVLIGRQLPNGQVAFAMFLVDMYCLGVKDVILNVMGRLRFQSEILDPLHGSQTVETISPACARKLVEGAVAYAQSLGLPPHEDYRQAKYIFGDIDGALCPEEFTYGKDGKPMFIEGPSDSPGRVRRILYTLSQHMPPDAFDYVVAADQMLPEELEHDEESEDET